MVVQKCDSIFVTYGQQLATSHAPTPTPLKNNTLMTLILDTLGRQDRHHVALLGPHSETLYRAIIDSIVETLQTSEHTSHRLRQSNVLYFDTTHFVYGPETETQINEDFRALCTELKATHKTLIFCINQLLLDEVRINLATLEKNINSILTAAEWRLVIFTNRIKYGEAKARYPYWDQYFQSIPLCEPNKTEALAILRTHKERLENFHQVSLPDESLQHALTMATRYMGGTQSLMDKALELLDSSAAQCGAADHHGLPHHYRPMVTDHTLASVVSRWTHIPLSHLQPNPFKTQEFVQSLQRHLYGQEAAISLIGLALQHADIQLQERTGPVCSFLFAGPANVGKTETAYQMAEQLFGHSRALLHVNLEGTYAPSSLASIKVMTRIDEDYCASLCEAIQRTPYAVVFLENMDQAPIGTLDLFKDIFTQGFAIDHQGNKFDFRHAIFVITTTLGGDRLTSLTQPHAAPDLGNNIDLMQLVLNELPNDTVPHSETNLLPQELCDEVLPALEHHFSASLLRHLTVIPFIPLDYAASEKIIRVKLKVLVAELESHFGIELNYAPEIIRFLVQQIMWGRGNAKSIDKLLEQHLYTCVSREIVARTHDTNRPKRLLLQLNDTGLLLRCEFISPSDATLYKIN